MCPVVSPNNTRKGAYGDLLNKIAKVGKCPFCEGEFEKYNPPPLRTYNGWFAANSIRKYRNASDHFLIISVKHKEAVTDLTPADMEAVLTLTQWLVKEYDLKGFGWVLRVGKMRYTNATVQHLHFHVVQCDVEKTWPWWTREHWLNKWFPQRRAISVQIGNPAAKE